MLVYHLVDDIAERYLDMIDAFNAEIDELEDNVEGWPAGRIRARLTGCATTSCTSARRSAPPATRCGRVVDDRVHVEGRRPVRPRDRHCTSPTRSTSCCAPPRALELSRDLIAGVRDYHQAKVANDQNEVMKKLTVIASVLLLPTFIVGLYGQNFRPIPELRWHQGYAFSWVLIIVTTICAAVVVSPAKEWI